MGNNSIFGHFSRSDFMTQGCATHIPIQSYNTSTRLMPMDIVLMSLHQYLTKRNKHTSRPTEISRPTENRNRNRPIEISRK